MARLSEEEAIHLAREHAAVCGVMWGQFHVKTQRKWYFRVVGYALDVTSADGTFQAYVPATLPCVTWCEFYPTNPETFLIPPWLTCPPWINGVSMHWRMGFGEYYWRRWFEWLQTLPRHRQDEYIDRFPVAGREGWEFFWDAHGPSLLSQTEPNSS